MEPKELLTKRRIEKLAEPYEGIGEIPKVAKQGERKYDVFVSHHVCPVKVPDGLYKV